MSYSIILLTLLSFQITQPSIDRLQHRTLLDSEIQIDEILPPGVVPLAHLSAESATIAPILTSLGYGTGVLAICYGVITADLLYMAYQISKKTTWAYWYAQEAKNLSQQELAQKIMQCLSEKCESSPNEQTFLLNQFIETLNQELSLIKRFMACRAKIAQLKLNFIFINQDSVTNNAIQSMQDLSRLKELALSLLRNRY